MPAQRKIIHIDMDAFYAAVEQRDQPALRGRPVVVGGDPAGRGVVATASYEARVFGIHSAMPAAHARRLCPEAVFLRPRFSVYREVSRELRAIMTRYTGLIEPLSLDEAYLDVSDCQQFSNSATLIARDIRRAIYDELGLTASAGVSYNKFLAKLASDIDKPDGQHLIMPEQGPGFIAGLPIGRFHGIGRATEARMKALGIQNGADLRAWPLERLVETFGKLGRRYFQLARAIDERPVVSERVHKSIGAETTFPQDLADTATMLAALEQLAAEVAANLERRGLQGQTLTLKVKYTDFHQITRSYTASRPLRGLPEMRALLALLLARTDAASRPVRLLGVTASHLMPRVEERQLSLF